MDVDGPKGMDYAAVPIGRINVPSGQNKNEVHYGIHKVMPLVETRVPFELDIWELDNVTWGNEDIDLDNLQEAANKIAAFEEKAVYEGFSKANIQGLLAASDHEAMSMTDNLEQIVEQLSKAIVEFQKKGIQGPYNFVVGPEIYQKLNSHMKGYPLKKQLEKVIEGKIILAPGIDQSLLVSARGGDFRLTIVKIFPLDMKVTAIKKCSFILRNHLPSRYWIRQH